MPNDRPIVIAGGGTGGHVFPGLALGQEVRLRQPDRPVEWIGAQGGLEERLVPQAGLPLRALPMAGMAKRGTGQRLTAGLLAASATLRLALGFLSRRPALVVGVGGFASGPAVLAAALLGIPTLLLEQNAIAGATNRHLARWARAAAVSFAESAAGFSCRTVVTGNPVRPEIAAIPERPPGPVREILGFGGSRGARPLNLAWIGALPLLRDLPVKLVLQTGTDDLEAVRTAAGPNPANMEILPFFDDMPARLARADLVVCRAGATTVAELAAAGRAAILVPFPQAANDHQTANARALADQGAALMLPQTDLTPERLAAQLRDLTGTPERVTAISRAARALGKPDATQRVAALAFELIEEGR